MKAFWTVLLVLISNLVLAVSDLPWSNSLEPSLALAKKQHKPILLFMKVEWSEYCTQMKREVFTDKKVIQDAKAFIPVMIDGDHEGRTIARKYAVQGYPEVLFLDSNGVIISRASGILNATDFQREMKTALDSLKAFPLNLAKVQKDPKDVDALTQLARIYAARKDFNSAKSMLSRAEKVDPVNLKSKLGPAWIAVGDALQNAFLFNDALDLFRKCSRLSRNSSEIAYAQSSIAACLVSLNHYDEAMKELESIIALPTTPAKDRAQAQKTLDRMKGKN